MTPKEKAIELFNEYLKILGGINSDDWHYFHGEEAKQCALIAVDEIMDEAHTEYKYQYWKQVKNEIEKL